MTEQIGMFSNEKKSMQQVICTLESEVEVFSFPDIFVAFTFFGFSFPLPSVSLDFTRTFGMTRKCLIANNSLDCWLFFSFFLPFFFAQLESSRSELTACMERLKGTEKSKIDLEHEVQYLCRSRQELRDIVVSPNFSASCLESHEPRWCDKHIVFWSLLSCLSQDSFVRERADVQGDEEWKRIRDETTRALEVSIDVPSFLSCFVFVEYSFSYREAGVLEIWVGYWWRCKTPVLFFSLISTFLDPRTVSFVSSPFFFVQDARTELAKEKEKNKQILSQLVALQEIEIVTNLSLCFFFLESCIRTCFFFFRQMEYRENCQRIPFSFMQDYNMVGLLLSFLWGVGWGLESVFCF